ncbi:MAG: NAD-dependent epimerase/dehydratase family protein [Acidimicrobiales bacterium]
MVTGATGFIASRLLPALADAGWAVRACGRRARPGWMPADVAYLPADLAADDLGALTVDVTHVFHLAGASSSVADEAEMQRSNVSATQRLVDALGPGVRRFVHMSSTSVYGESVQLPLPVVEDVEPQPSRSYGKAKWGAEQAVWSAAAAAAGLPAVVLRPVSVFGPGAVKLLASVLLDAALERFAGLDRFGVAGPPIEQRLVHVDDLVAACLYLASHPDAVGKAFNVASLYPSSHEVAEVVAAEIGLELEVVDDPEAEVGLAGDARQAVHDQMVASGMTTDIILSPERLRLLAKGNCNNRLSNDALAATGFRFVHTDLATEIAADVAWYRDRRWLI